MLLDLFNIVEIKNMVHDYPDQPIKFYIFKLNPSSVNQGSKMVNIFIFLVSSVTKKVIL